MKEVLMGNKKDKEERRMTVMYHSAKAIEEASQPVTKKRRGKALEYKPCPMMNELLKNLV